MIDIFFAAMFTSTITGLDVAHLARKNFLSRRIIICVMKLATYFILLDEKKQKKFLASLLPIRLYTNVSQAESRVITTFQTCSRLRRR